MIKRLYTEVTQSRFIIKNLVNQALTVKYKRSILGFFWSVINPLANMLILAAVFSNIMRLNIRDYVVFLYSAMLPWSFFAQAAEIGASSIVTAEGFIKKIYVPKIVFPLSNVLTIFINVLFQFVALFFILLFRQATISPALLFLPVSFAILFVLVTGVSLLTTTACVYFRDIPYLINVLMSAWYYLTPIIYPLDLISENLQPVFLMNPMYYFIQLFRGPIYDHMIPSEQTLVITTVIAVVVLFVGLFVFYRRERDFVYRL
ncbi:MAG: ABC transporter permease [Christensenellaceae bacterium]|nr:ABC transporter permease [Christensenellaceae bacterium]